MGEFWFNYIYLIVGNEVEVLIVKVIRLVRVVMVMVVLDFVIIVLIMLFVGMLCGCWLSLFIMMNMLLMLILRIKKGNILMRLIKGIWYYMVSLNLVSMLSVIVNIFVLVSKEWFVRGFKNLLSII